MVSRRNFLRGRFRGQGPALRPPWALAEALFLSACTRCGECVSACPERIIRLEGGYPVVDFSDRGCSFCGACAKACTHGALQDSELQIWPWAIKATIGTGCLAARGTECRTCGDHCSVTAIRFSPRVGGPPVPEIDSNACTGCGACVAPCPAGAVVIA